MYSRGYDNGGIESDGVLHELERRYEARPEMSPPPPQEQIAPASAMGGGIKKLFSRFELEDLLIIAVALIVLLDGNAENDIILIVLAVLLFF